MKTKKCSKCPETKPLSEFHGGPDSKKSKCKTCTLDEYFFKKQDGLKNLFEKGEPGIGLCPCGNYFKNLINRGLGMERADLCRTCIVDENKTKYKRRTNYAELADKFIELEKTVKELVDVVREIKKAG